MGWQEQERERYKQQQAEKARAEQQEAAQQRLLLKSQFEEQQRIAAEQSAVRERQAQEKLLIEMQQGDEASQRLADGLKLLDAQRQERLRLSREKTQARKMPAPQPASLSKKSLRAVKQDNPGFGWLFGRIVIIVLTILWVLGANFTRLSFLASNIVPIITGLGLLVMYETWYVTKHPSRTNDNHGLIHLAKILQPRYLWQNRKLRIGSIILVVILIAGTIFYSLLPHTNPPTHTDISPISYPSSLNGKGVLMLNNTLKDQASNTNWEVDSPYCYFTDSYHAWAEGNNTRLCFAHNTNFADFVFQVEMVIVRADDSFGGGGIIFRADSLNSQYYGFFITKAGDGELFISSSSGSENRLVLKKGSIQGLQTSDRQINLIEVVAQGDQIQVYVNKILFAEVTDDTYSHGQIGVFVQGSQLSDFFTDETEVAFFNAKVWKL